MGIGRAPASQQVRYVEPRRATVLIMSSNRAYFININMYFQFQYSVSRRIYTIILKRRQINLIEH